jgi:hypothetical protein
VSSELESLYKNRPVLLWVEDTLTRAWLRQLWQDADIGVLVAGGNDAVFAAVKDAREGGHANVFGVRDRDFTSPNQAHWLDRAKTPTVFVPEAHEVENLLLDFDGLAALDANHNPRRRTAEDLAQRAHQRASEGLWWMAARATIAEVRMGVTADFPSHPKLGSPPLTSRDDAQRALEARLLGSAWGAGVRTVVNGLDARWVAEHLEQHGARLQAQLDDGAWRWTWSGKELFAHIAGYLGCAVPDLAKGLAEHQRTHDRVDPVMIELRAALRKRAGVEGW